MRHDGVIACIAAAKLYLSSYMSLAEDWRPGVVSSSVVWKPETGTSHAPSFPLAEGDWTALHQHMQIAQALSMCVCA